MRPEKGCWLCSNQHMVSESSKLKGAPAEKRCDLVKESKLCFNCLSNTHMVKA